MATKKLWIIVVEGGFAEREAVYEHIKACVKVERRVVVSDRRPDTEVRGYDKLTVRADTDDITGIKKFIVPNTFAKVAIY